MPLSAIMLLVCEAGKFHDVARDVAKIKGVTKAFPCLGRWDVVVRIEATDLAELSDVVLKVNASKGVRATETLIQATV